MNRLPLFTSLVIGAIVGLFVGLVIGLTIGERLGARYEPKEAMAITKASIASAISLKDSSRNKRQTPGWKEVQDIYEWTFQAKNGADVIWRIEVTEEDSKLLANTYCIVINGTPAFEKETRDEMTFGNLELEYISPNKHGHYRFFHPGLKEYLYIDYKKDNDCIYIGPDYPVSFNKMLAKMLAAPGRAGGEGD